MKYLQVEIPVLQVMPRRHAEPGMRLEKSVFTPDGRVLAEGQTTLTENLLEKFKNFNVRNLIVRVKQKHWIGETEAESLPPEAKVIAEEQFAEAAEDIIDSIQETNSVRKMRKVAEFLGSQARQGGDQETAEEMDEIIERSYELENKIEELTAKLQQVEAPEARNKIMEALEGAISELEETFLEIAAPDNILNSTIEVVNERENIKSSITDFVNDNQQMLEDNNKREEENKLASEKISDEYQPAVEKINQSNTVEATEELEKQAKDEPTKEKLNNLKEELTRVEDKKEELKKELLDECKKPGPRKHISDLLEGRVEFSRKKLEAMPVSDDFARKSYELVEEKENLHKKLWDAANEVSDEEFEKHFDPEKFQKRAAGSGSQPDFVTNGGAINSADSAIDEEELEKIITAFSRNNVQGGLRVIYSRTKQSDDFGASMLGQIDLTRQNISDLQTEAEKLSNKITETVDNERTRRVLLNKLASSVDIETDELAEMELPEELRGEIIEFVQNRKKQGTRVEQSLNELSNGQLKTRDKDSRPIYEGIKNSAGAGAFEEKIEKMTGEVGDRQEGDSKLQKLLEEEDPYDLSEYADIDVQTARGALHSFALPRISGDQKKLLQEVKGVAEQVLYRNKLPESKLMHLLEVTETILQDNNRPIKLLTQPPSGEQYLLAHATNTFLVSFIIGRTLEVGEDKLLELGAAAICQDLGMAEIPLGLWAKKDGDLTGRGWQEIQKHPLHTKNILSQTVEEEDPVVELAAQHHEHQDGSGYPKGLTVEEQHPLASVLSTADAYTAMLEKRPHRSAGSPDKVLLSMLKNDEKFDRTTVNSLLKTIGFYPTGSVVLLEDRRLALVREQNRDQPVAPRVFILTDKKRNKLSEPRPLDLSEDGLKVSKVVKY